MNGPAEQYAHVLDGVSAAAPVFLVGMNGSGTTMLLDSLGRHSALYAFPRETRVLPHLISTYGKVGNLQDDANFRRLWDAVRTIGVLRYVNDGREVPLPPDWAQCPRDIGSVIDRVMRVFAAKEGKERWCEKTPQHAQHMLLLAAVFPNAKFIHVIRDGRDSAASFKRRWSRTPALTIFRWKKVVAEGRRQGTQLGTDRYMEVKYEELTQDPQAWLRKISAFLGVAFESATLESRDPYLKRKDGEAGRIRRNSGRWREAFSAAQVRQLEHIAGRILSELGYDAEHVQGDFDPPKWRRDIWMLQDYAAQFLKEIGKRVKGDIKRPWWVILRRPFVAWRQRRMNKY
jgi:hypothetical protein